MKSVRPLFNTLRTHVDREVMQATDADQEYDKQDVYGDVWYATRSNMLMLNGPTIGAAHLQRILELEQL